MPLGKFKSTFSPIKRVNYTIQDTQPEIQYYLERWKWSIIRENVKPPLPRL